MGSASTRQVGYRTGVASLKGPNPYSQRDLREKLLRTFQDPNYRPPLLPKVVIDVLELSRRPDASFAAVSDLLEQDPMLAAYLLRVARSAAFSMGRPIQSIKEALVRLGLGTVRDIFFQAAISSRVFKAPGYEEPMNRVVRHSTATAHICRLLSRRTPESYDHAFLCGLLHDIGIAVSMIVLADVPRGETPIDVYAVCDQIIEVHCDAGRKICDLWKLPAEVASVIQQHHGVGGDAQPHRMAATIRVAEVLGDELGFGLPGEVGKAESWAFEALGIGEIERALLLEEARGLLALVMP